MICLMYGCTDVQSDILFEAGLCLDTNLPSDSFIARTRERCGGNDEHERSKDDGVWEPSESTGFAPSTKQGAEDRSTDELGE
jgi:hypothetical protein